MEPARRMPVLPRRTGRGTNVGRAKVDPRCPGSTIRPLPVRIKSLECLRLDISLSRSDHPSAGTYRTMLSTHVTYEARPAHANSVLLNTHLQGGQKCGGRPMPYARGGSCRSRTRIGAPTHAPLPVMQARQGADCDSTHAPTQSVAVASAPGGACDAATASEDTQHLGPRCRRRAPVESGADTAGGRESSPIRERGYYKR